MPGTRVLHALFAANAVLHLVAVWVGNDPLRFWTKPFIVVLLLVWLVTGTRLKGRYQKLMAMGLIAALLGDVMLLFPGNSFFMAGLAAFFFCHLCYIRAFRLDYLSDPAHVNPYFKWALVVFGVFCAALVIFLNPGLGSMRLPVLLYAFVICWMAVMAVNRFGRVNEGSFRMVFAGAVFFIISDAVLAINRFVLPFAGAHVVIMGTYILAQYLLVAGAVARRLRVLQTPVD